MPNVCYFCYITGMPYECIIYVAYLILWVGLVVAIRKFLD